MEVSAPVVSAQQEKLVFCSDIAFPPMESMQNGQAIGADIDIGNEVGKRIGRPAEFTNVGFDGIIAALQANKCDAIISGMNDTPERAKQVNFVDYLNVGQSLVVKKGNPLGIISLETICGHAAGAQVGTTNLDTLNTGKRRLQIRRQAGDQRDRVQGRFRRLVGPQGRPHRCLRDRLIGRRLLPRPGSGLFEFGGPAIGALPVGIAFRKDQTALRDQVHDAIEAMYADGTIRPS